MFLINIPGTRGMVEVPYHPLPGNEDEWPTLGQTYNLPVGNNQRRDPPPFVKMNVYEYVLEQD